MALRTAVAASTGNTSFVLVASDTGLGTGFGMTGSPFSCCWDAPLTGTTGLTAGLIRGTAGMIRPLLVALTAGRSEAGDSCVTAGAGGARAAATSGFDSVGGGGPLDAFTGSSGEIDELGRLTVALGLSGEL